VWACCELGHRVVTRLAEKHLTLKAKAAIASLLDDDESVADSSLWADKHRGALPKTAPWHYLDVLLDEPRYDVPFSGDVAAKGCVVDKINEFRLVSKDQAKPLADAYLQANLLTVRRWPYQADVRLAWVLNDGFSFDTVSGAAFNRFCRLDGCFCGTYPYPRNPGTKLMEVVNTTGVLPATCVASLLERRGLERLIGTDACACFVVARPLDAPHLFEHLIKNVASIDSTTHQHIAFIVFYGESTVDARANHYHEPYQTVEAKLGISYRRGFDARFDDTYGALFRDSPQLINPALFEQFMARSSDALMACLGLRAQDAPCLVFVDPKQPANKHVVKLNAESAIDFIYFEILSPLSDGFRDLRGWVRTQQLLFDLRSRHTAYQRAKAFLETADEREHQLRAYIEALDEELRILLAHGNASAASVRVWDSAALSDDRRKKLKGAIEKLKQIDTALEVMEAEVAERGESGERTLRQQMFKKRRGKCELRMRYRLKDARSELDQLCAERARHNSVWEEATGDIDERLKAGEREYAEYTKASLASGYDWERVDGEWPSDNRNLVDHRSGPRAFGVVKYILERVLRKDVSGSRPYWVRASSPLKSAAESGQHGLSSVAAWLRRNETRTFLSYRRSDSQDVTGRIYDRLTVHLPPELVIKDVDSIPLAVSFPEWIRQTLDKTHVMIAIIGPAWLAISDVTGRRIDDPGDVVRWEIETALKLRIPVIPVTVSNADMPKAAELPESLRPLAFLNGQTVRPDPDFHRDMDRLILRIGKCLTTLRGNP